MTPSSRHKPVSVTTGAVGWQKLAHSQAPGEIERQARDKRQNGGLGKPSVDCEQF